jgi:hypothetical protein
MILSFFLQERKAQEKKNPKKATKKMPDADDDLFSGTGEEDEEVGYVIIFVLLSPFHLLACLFCRWKRSTLTALVPACLLLSKPNSMLPPASFSLSTPLSRLFLADCNFVLSLSYAIPRNSLHYSEQLRSPDDWAKGTMFGKDELRKNFLLSQSEPITKSLTKPPDAKKEIEYNKKAISVFARIQAFMGDKEHKFPEQCATELMKMGYQDEEIRDEIYVQCIKQINCHPKMSVFRFFLAFLFLFLLSSPLRLLLFSEGLKSGLQLLGLICEAFPPSDLLLPYVMYFIYHNSKVDCTHYKYAKYCLHTLWVSPCLAHSRLFLPHPAPSFCLSEYRPRNAEAHHRFHHRPHS